MRSFYLVNNAGGVYSLDEPTHCWMSVKGLGFSRSFEFVKSGSDYLQTSEKTDQASPSGDLYLATYDDYLEFIQFISKSPLFLYYRPDYVRADTQKWYRCTVRVKSIEKTEIDYTIGMLKCPLTFIAYDTWHEMVTAYSSHVTTVGGKKYELDSQTSTYGYKYNYTYIDGESGEINVTNGDFESPIKLHIYGPCTDPQWSLSQYGAVVQTGKVNTSIASGEKLVINSDPSDMQIAVYNQNNNFLRNAYQYSDFTTARFLYAPPGESVIKVITGASANIAYAELEKIVYPV